MTEPIEEVYFNWLCAKVLEPYNTNYRDLMRILHTTEFVWFVLGDRNRKEDGEYLRQYFLNESGYYRDDVWMNQPCSVLEMLISFAQRATFQIGFSDREWFWMFMENLNLNEYRQISILDKSKIEEILNVFIQRVYDSHGYGGLFPLREAKEDQRDVEIWYQFCAWVDEKELI